MRSAAESYLSHARNRLPRRVRQTLPCSLASRAPFGSSRERPAVDFMLSVNNLTGIRSRHFVNGRARYGQCVHVERHICSKHWLLHLWSLSVEEQFYIVFPPLMIILWTHARNSMLPALYAFAAVSFSASVWMTFEAPLQAFFLPIYRAWELLVGAIIAFGGI